LQYSDAQQPATDRTLTGIEPLLLRQGAVEFLDHIAENFPAQSRLLALPVDLNNPMPVGSLFARLLKWIPLVHDARHSILYMGNPSATLICSTEKPA
jgi:hypothetical protein